MKLIIKPTEKEKTQKQEKNNKLNNQKPKENIANLT